MKDKSLFSSRQQYQRYLYAIKLGKMLKSLHEKGFLIIDSLGHKLEGSIVLDGSDIDIVSIKNQPTTTSIIALEEDSNGKPWVESKENIRKAFSEFNIINPRYIFKVK